MMTEHVKVVIDDPLDFAKYGTATKYDETIHKDMKKFYVIERVSENTIKILYK